MAIDMDKLNAFIGRFVGDLGAAVHAGMVVIGEKLGLYKALAAHPMTSAELAAGARRQRTERATFENGWRRRRRVATSLMTRRPTSSALPRNRPSPSLMKTARRTCQGPSN